MLVALSFVFFGIAHLTPGGICSLYPDRTLDACSSSLRLKAILPEQYGTWLGDYLHGDFGHTQTGQSVASQILGGLPITTVLLVGTFGFLVLGAFIQVFMATVKRPRVTQRLASLAAMVVLSLPAFWFGLMLIYILAVHWQALPAGQVDSDNIQSFWSSAWFSQLAQSPRMVLLNLIKHLMLPAFVLATIVLTVDGVLRSHAARVIGHSYLRTPGFRGRRRTKVILTDGVKQLLRPALSDIPRLVPALITGVVIVEAVFRYAGLGSLFYTSLGGHEYAAVLSLLMLASLVLVVVNFVADVSNRTLLVWELD